MRGDSISYRLDTATAETIAAHLTRCDPSFVPPLSSRVDLPEYALKICTHAVRFEAWSTDVLAGLLAAYCNDRERRHGYITNVSVLDEWRGAGIATHLLQQCVRYGRHQGLLRLDLDVTSDHRRAVGLYERCGFSVDGTRGPVVKMKLDL